LLLQKLDHPPKYSLGWMVLWFKPIANGEYGVGIGRNIVRIAGGRVNVDGL
jgi:Tfp pilus assembly protein PilZ